MATYNVDLQDDQGNSYRTMANPDSKAEFTEATSRENINSGETHRTIFGKLRKFLSDLGAAAYIAIANNCTTTAAGFALDARQGKVLMDKSNQISSDLANGQIEFNLQDGKGVYRQKGADTWIPFKARPTLLGKYSTVSTLDLSNVSGYETLTVDDFLCIANSGNTSGSKYENDSNGTIQLSIVYTAAQLSIASGILTITPALLSGSAFHNPATATAKNYLQTSVYLIN